MHIYIPAGSKTVHVSMDVATQTQPVGLFYHIIAAGRGSLALCCSQKTVWNVSRGKKMRKEGMEEGKERGNGGGGGLPADNEIKPIREK